MNLNEIKKTLFRHFDIPQVSQVEAVIKKFSFAEKIVFWFFGIFLTLGTLGILNTINESFMIEVPAKGGEITEGCVGLPRFVNPLLAISNADNDVVSLVYSGLMKTDLDGDLIPDLAEEYNISDDGLVYTFKIRDDAFFHDGAPVTAEDIEWTIKLSLDNLIKSSKRANWDGIKTEIIGSKEIRFTLKTPYSPFLENTTLGILPKHIWGQMALEQFAFSEFNVQPIGSGPYKIIGVKKNSSGIIEEFDLKAFDKYTLGEPYITNLKIKFYPNEESLVNGYKKGEVKNINSISPEIAKELEKNKTKIKKIPLPRIFGVFFNQNQNQIFADTNVRKALNISLDKEKIVNQVLNGYGIPINNPVPNTSKYFDSSIKKEEYNLEKGIEILEKDSWKLRESGVREKTVKKKTTQLSFTISTSDAPELKAVANLLKEDWEKLGAKVTIKIFEIGDLNQNTIRPREYDCLLFGEIIGRDMDLFAFWHSSQRNDPGLNIAMYANTTVDKLLEETRSINDEKKRSEKFEKIQQEIIKDTPAVFVYSPEFIYVMPDEIKNLSLNQITTPAERFLDIHNWYIKTNSLWKIFNSKQKINN